MKIELIGSNNVNHLTNEEQTYYAVEELFTQTYDNLSYLNSNGKLSLKQIIKSIRELEKALSIVLQLRGYFILSSKRDNISNH